MNTLIDIINRSRGTGQSMIRVARKVMGYRPAPADRVGVTQVFMGDESPVGGSGTSATFPDLTDTPDDYVGDANKVVTVNATEDALEFTTAGGGGIGDVVGPAGATDEAVARYDTATGKLLQDSGVTIDDTGNVVVPAGVIINEGGGDFDFRVEGDGVAYVLGVIASHDMPYVDRLVVGTSAFADDPGTTNLLVIGHVQIDDPPTCRMFPNATMTNLTAGTWTKVVLDLESYDTNGIGDTGLYRITPGVAGKYLIKARVTWASGFAAGDRMSAAVRVSGTALIPDHKHGNGTTWLTNPMGDVLDLTAANYVELWARSGAAGNTADIAGGVNTMLLVHRLS